MARTTTGTLSVPYVKRDGTQTIKYSVTLPAELVQSMRMHVASLGLGHSESAWIANVIEDAIARDAPGKKANAAKRRA